MRLTTYTGSCTITKANTVIDAKTINCDVDIRAADVTIKRSKVNGAVGLDTDVSGSNKWSYTLVDSEVDAGVRQYPAVSYGNMTIIRTNIYGGETSVAGRRPSSVACKTPGCRGSGFRAQRTGISAGSCPTAAMTYASATTRSSVTRR
jgi:hypothetical protein